jgi:hypothetical protein
MKFKIEQIALAISQTREAEALALLAALGITEWTHDTVTAKGDVLADKDVTNVAALSFNYTALSEARELELLRYREGRNWLQFDLQPRVSHLGMHVTEWELAEFRALLEQEHHLMLAQEVFTQQHTNPAIAGKRWYHYVIYKAVHLIGVDLKFIVRRDSL